jgi:hypothetical protein
MARTLGMRRTMTPNQIVAYNVARARALRGWTQEQAAEALAPYLGAKLSGPSFSALERSAWTIHRIKQFSVDELLALSRGFDLPVGFFLTPPPPADDIGLHAPDAGMKGLDPIVLLNAILGTPDNLGPWRNQLLAYSAGTAPMPKSKREEPSVSPSDLADRLEPFIALRAQAIVRQSLGDVAEAGDVLERLADALRLLDATASGSVADEPARAETGAERRGRRKRKASQ